MKKDITANKALLVLFALIAPYILIPIETILPYPYVIEELVKLALVLKIAKLEKRTKQSKIWLLLVIIVLFSISESVVYLFNIFLIGRLDHFFLRIVLTLPMHVMTSLVMYVGRKSRIGLFLGLVIAILIHYFFNTLIAS